MAPVTRRYVLPLAWLAVGLASWAIGVAFLRPSAISAYGLLTSAKAWFPLGLAVLLVGYIAELRREARVWLLGLYLAALIVAIHTTVPILYGGTPEYSWVYKHIGLAQSLRHYGRVTDSSNIYQAWPAFFAVVAAISALAHVSPLSFAAWAPVAFELANALLLTAVFLALVRERRVAFLAVLVYVGLIAWIGQDYLSPQAFAFLLWLGLMLIVFRWLRAPLPGEPRGGLSRLRARLLAGMADPIRPSRRARIVAVLGAAFLYTAIVPSHQLTPYMALVGLAGLALFGLIRPRWLFLLFGTIAIGYLVPRYRIIADNFGGIFSGLNPLQNATTLRGTTHAGAEATTAYFVRGLAVFMWLIGIGMIVKHRRTLGRVAIPTVLAFCPFFVLLAQKYGGEAIYRVYLFSAPWCALLIATLLMEVRAQLWRWLCVTALCLAVLFAGLQGLYGPVRVNAFTPSELQGSLWLYGHVPHGSLIALPVDYFPIFETYDYDAFRLERMPSDLQLDVSPWMDESNLAEVEHWVADYGMSTAYFVVSRNMDFYVDYFGPPTGFPQLQHTMATAPGWSIIYRNQDVSIFRLDVG